MIFIKENESDVFAIVNSIFSSAVFKKTSRYSHSPVIG